jgi:hypothetical protein
VPDNPVTQNVLVEFADGVDECGEEEEEEQ